MNRHHTKKRMAARMAKRRARIVAEDRWLRYARSLGPASAMSAAAFHSRNVAAVSTKTAEESLNKKLELIKLSIKSAELGVEALRIRSTPTEVMQTL